MASSSSPTPTTALLALPAELIAHIASFLPKKDLLALRLTSRQCQQTTQPAIASAFFSTVAIDLCKPSLERLARIAQDPHLRPHVRTVLFAGYPHVRCRLPPTTADHHNPGSGYYWRRIGRPSRAAPPRLNPDPDVNPAIALLRTALAALPRLHTLAVDPDLGANPEPHIPTATALCVFDVLHLALLCTSTATVPPLRRFRILPGGELAPWRSHALAPRAALDAAWGGNLVELALVAQPVPTPAEEAEYWALLTGMVRQARGLRKLVVADARWGFYEVLAAVLGEEGEAGMPPLEVLEMQRLPAVRRVDVLARFVLGFRRSLRHVGLVFVAMGAAEEWKGVLAEWAVGLECLRSFQLRELKVTASPAGVVMRLPGRGVLVFDGITEWAGSDGVPDEGTVEFASRTVNLGKERVTGFRFACAEGREGKCDAQRVLGKLAEVARVEVKQRPNWEQEATEWTQVEKRFLIGGKLEANYSTAIKSPELDLPF